MSAAKEKEPLKLDVYARPFVPQALRYINQAAANIVPSLPVRWIDFDNYVQKFAGSDFLIAKSSSQGQSEHMVEAAGSQMIDQKSKPSVVEGDLDSSSLNAKSYRGYFLTALEKEEVAQKRECDDHAMFRFPVRNRVLADSRPNMWSLEVPGLREMSLRIELGDVVQLRQLRFNARGDLISPPLITDTNGKIVSLPRHADNQYDAVVWNIDRRNELLLLRVDRLTRMSMLFNVCFTVQSGRIRALHRAVNTLADVLESGSNNSWARSMLFPESADGYYQKTLNKATLNLDLHDEMLNYEQVKAVNTVLSEPYGPVPFIISGPPGTGKTKTIVECAMQILHKNDYQHLLICAPSDPAADTLVQRLSRHLGPSDLLRVNSPSRSLPEVPVSILSYCCVDDGMFSLPPFGQIMNRSIVVTTCRDADILVRARLSNTDLYNLERGLYTTLHPNRKPDIEPVLHWTGLLIDEAAQATEPEALIPLTVVSPPVGRNNGGEWPILVMAGDQHQLGPRTASKTDPIQTSLFERLLNRPFYRDHLLARSKQSGGVMRPLTNKMLPILRPAFANLIRNYRSHPAILATPSSLFYNDTLEPEATATESLLRWQGWRSAGIPVLFSINRSADEIEQDGGGWYNIAEARMSCQFAKSFLQIGLVQPNEICIMSPFQAQVKVIRQLARQDAMSGVNIGPLEAFQGLESRLVIVCTTRTRNRFIDQDLARGLGVIHEPKRFNVALTRAKEGLIVIGNPDVLRQDVNWRAFLAFCARNQLSDGIDVDDWTDKDTDHVHTSRLEKQLLHQLHNSNATDGFQSLANGSRRLGSVEDADHALWKSGVEFEASLRNDEHEDEA